MCKIHCGEIKGAVGSDVMKVQALFFRFSGEKLAEFGRVFSLKPSAEHDRCRAQIKFRKDFVFALQPSKIFKNGQK